MKNILLITAFLGLVVVLSQSDKRDESLDQVEIHFSEGRSMQSLKIYPDKKSEDLIVEFFRLSPSSLSKDLNAELRKVRFKAKLDACEFVATRPVLFNCENDKKAKLISAVWRGGKKVVLKSISSALYKGSSIGEKGHIIEQDVYAVKTLILVGGKEHMLIEYTTPNLVKKKVQPLISVAKVSEESNAL